MRILLVEDNIRLAQAIAENLGAAGFDIEPVATGAEVLPALARAKYDLVILDLGLAETDGLDILRELRSQKSPVPVLVLTGRDKLGGLNKGTDDYIVKPFETEELVARLKALLKRPAVASNEIITLNNLSFDTTNRQTKIGGDTLELSRRETDLLEQLIRSIDKIVTKKSIETRLYNYDDKGSANSVEVLVHRLRKKLGAHAARIEIHTLRGIGYMISATRTDPATQ